VNTATDQSAETLLVVEPDVMARFALAGYLRGCGYRVIETATADEAITLLSHDELAVDIVLSAVEPGGSMSGFALARWARARHANIEVVLAGTLEKAAEQAGDLCEQGPHLSRP